MLSFSININRKMDELVPSMSRGRVTAKHYIKALLIHSITIKVITSLWQFMIADTSRCLRQAVDIHFSRFQCSLLNTEL